MQITEALEQTAFTQTCASPKQLGNSISKQTTSTNLPNKTEKPNENKESGDKVIQDKTQKKSIRTLAAKHEPLT